MKQFFLLVLCGWMMLPIAAVNYCASSSWGYVGTSVTGGGSVSPTLVKSESELKTVLKNSNKVIIITQNITVSNQISCDKSNLTILALPGARLISTGQSKDVSGILYLRGSNLILRNLIFEGPGAYDCDGKDLLTLNGDIFISLDTVRSNAEMVGVSFDQELMRILIHGVLHLTGQGDKTPETKAEMTAKEEQALARLGGQ